MTPTPTPAGRPAIRLTGIDMTREDRKVLDDVSVTIGYGDFVAVTGPNGGGKTTLLRIILKLLKPTRGRVEYLGPDGRPVNRLPLGYLPQKNMIDPRFPMTVTDVIASGLLGIRGLDRAGRDALVADMLHRVELTDHARKPIGNLSGGQLQRALLGRALVSNPGVLVLDEPLSYIDKHFEQRIYDIIGSLRGQATVILVSHEMSTIAGMANRHLIVDGRLHECAAARHIVSCECS